MTQPKDKGAAATGAAVLSLPAASGLRELLRNYLAWLVIIWPAIALYRYAPYYGSALSSDTQKSLLALALLYTLAGPAFYYLRLLQTGSLPEGRGLLALRTLWRLGIDYKSYLGRLVSRPFYPGPAITASERTNLLFIVVKLFFVPIMINFLAANLQGVHQSAVAANSGIHLSIFSFNTLIYPLVLGLLLVIDTGYFTFGYLVESRQLNNRVVSVDPTFLGWFSCLICYPPVSSLSANYLPWYANDYAVFRSQALTAVIHFAGLAFMFIYACASVALGPKASNLTNRGIVSRWPYSLVRHPAYITKNIAWWLTIIPVATPAAVAGMAVWSFIYFLRSVTEERHLMMADNGYKQYAARVHWRFVPGVY